MNPEAIKSLAKWLRERGLLTSVLGIKLQLALHLADHKRWARSEQNH